MTTPDISSGIDKKPRVLVADDTDVNRKIAQLILQRAGYRVDVAENGQQAAEACRQHRYDLILMDIQMPVMDGYEATREIRALERKAKGSKLKENDTQELSASSFELSARAQRVPIIAMTGSAGPGSFDETRYPGMNDCIGKPLQRDFLLTAIQKWLRAESKNPSNENPADETPAISRSPENNQFPLDLDRAIQEFMGRKDILLGVLQNFLGSAAARIGAIRQAVRGADYSVIGSEAHAIKGAAANLRADELARLASGLEQAADQQQPDLTAELTGDLEREFDMLKQYVQQLPDV